MAIIQYKVWRKNSNHSGYPILVTPNKDKVEEYLNDDKYEVRQYVAYPVI